MRKVLSFVLVLTLVLSSFSMAFAGTSATSAGLSDIAGNANQDAIQVAYDLGIVTGNPDGTFLPEKAVNRAEFAAMLTRALDIPDSALAGYTATSFKDTAGYTWAVPYLAFCQSKGILLGDGAGNVMPGRTITVNEAMTMALRAIGYTANSSLLVGAWPANYVSIAQNNSLYDSVAKATTVDKANAAQIIYNLLTVQKVAVNSDGTTDYLWDGKASDGVEATLLNTNLGCTTHKDQILGSSGFGYADSSINITKDLGAYGDAYTNDNNDDKVVAFTKSSTALTGKLSDDRKKFEVGDTKYDISNADNDFVTDGAFFMNGDYVAADAATFAGNDGDGKIEISEIASFAALYADDGATVTLNVDLSGKTIKDIYSCVGWLATTEDLASSDVQSDITDDQSLLNYNFDTNDDDAINMNSFALIGVASLDKIAENNVVYVYNSHDDDVIRQVAVGTETVEGTVDGIDYGDDTTETNASTITVGDKDYDVSALATTDAQRVNVDDEGTFYLDYNGEVYDYNGTNTVNTYGIVKAWSPEGTDNFKVKLYTSEDATSTFAFNDSTNKIDWTSDGGATFGTIGAVETTGAMIGYSLDSNGQIKAVDNTYETFTAAQSDILSTKVVSLGGVSYPIDQNAPVFTYSGDLDSPDSVVTRADMDATVSPGTTAAIFNRDHDTVIALYISKAAANATDDEIYGVINSRTTSKNDDGDKVYKYTGFIDGTAFTYKTDTDMANDPVAPFFGVYGFTLDSSDQITDPINDLTATPYNVSSGISGYIALDKVITDVNSDKTVVTVGTHKYTIADDAVVYKYDVDNKDFTVSKLSALKKDYTISLFDTKGSDVDGTASVVVYYEN